MSGELFGVGLGPGDPELITMKAHRLIATAEVIAYPTLEAGESFARSIVADIISKNAEELKISVPMSVEREPAQQAYDKGAREIARVLDDGKDVVVLCEGDPFFYGSFMYLFSRLSKKYKTTIVPGVTSVTACAAAIAKPLSARNEMLSIIPGPLDEGALRTRIGQADSIAIMKVGRHLAKIKSVLIELGLMDYAVYVERATLPNEVVLPLSKAPTNAPYFSMILVTKGNDPWL